jgi:hypothetical protein
VTSQSWTCIQWPQFITAKIWGYSGSGAKIQASKLSTFSEGFLSAAWWSDPNFISPPSKILGWNFREIWLT